MRIDILTLFPEMFSPLQTSIMGRATKDGKLEITTTSNADSPISLDLGLPVICIDVWEHAYYLDYQNRRSDFVDTFLNHLIKW